MSNKNYLPFDSDQKTNLDDRNVFLQRNVTGRNLIDELARGNPSDVILNLARTGEKFSLKTALGDLIDLETNQPLESVPSKLVDKLRKKFVIGINDSVQSKSDPVYHRKITDKLEDPTILSFSLDIDTENSPLFSTELETFLETNANLFSRRKSYIFPEASSISLGDANVQNPYNFASLALSDFKTEILKIFKDFSSQPFTDSGAKFPAGFSPGDTKQYYIKKILGFNKLDKMYGTEESSNDGEFKLDSLEFVLNDDVRMSIRNLYFLYKSFTEQFMSGKMMIPENLLRFNFWIKISEVRNFTSLRNYIEEDNALSKRIIESIRNDVTSINYYIQDCIFDFDTLHDADEYSAESPDSPAELKFKIFFRRNFKVFKPTLLNSEVISENLTDKIFHIDQRLLRQFVFNKVYDPFNTDSGSTDESVSTQSDQSMEKKFPTFVNSGNAGSKSRRDDPVNFKTDGNENANSNNNNKNAFNVGANIYNTIARQVDANEIPTNFERFKENTLQKARRAADATLGRLRNNLVNNLKTTIQEKVGFGRPRPINVYDPSKTEGLDSVLRDISDTTKIDLVNLRNNPAGGLTRFDDRQLNERYPSLGSRNKILRGQDKDGYDQLNPNPDPDANIYKSGIRGIRSSFDRLEFNLNSDLNTRNLRQQDAHPTPSDELRDVNGQLADGSTIDPYQRVDRLDDFSPREEPGGDLHPEPEKLDDLQELNVNQDLFERNLFVSRNVNQEEVPQREELNVENLHPDSQIEQDLEDVDLHPEAEQRDSLTDLDLHPEAETQTLEDRNLNEEPAPTPELTDLDLHPEAETQTLEDRNLNEEPNERPNLDDQDLHPKADEKQTLDELNLNGDIDIEELEERNINKEPTRDSKLNQRNVYDHEQTRTEEINNQNVNPVSSEEKSEPEGNVNPKEIESDDEPEGNVNCDDK